MKKGIKKFIACVSILATLATYILPASAIYIESDYPAYEAWAEKMISSGYQRTENNPNVFYKSTNNPYVYKYIFVKVYDNTKVCYTIMTEYCEDLVTFGDLQVPSDEDINNFLEENNFGAVVDTTSEKDYDIKLKYNENVTSYEEIHIITDALIEEFSLYPLGISPVSMATIYFNTQEETTSPSIDVNTPTLAGDLNLDDEQGITDIVTLTKYTASPELYPITDATALANADVNQDGTIDSLDTNILIEMTLGSFESVV